MPARVYLTRRHVHAEQVSLRQRDPVALDQPDPLEPVHLAAGYANAISLVVQDIVHDHFGVRQGGDREGEFNRRTELDLLGNVDIRDLDGRPSREAEESTARGLPCLTKDLVACRTT